MKSARLNFGGVGSIDEIIVYINPNDTLVHLVTSSGITAFVFDDINTLMGILGKCIAHEGYLKNMEKSSLVQPKISPNHILDNRSSSPSDITMALLAGSLGIAGNGVATDNR